MKKENGSSWRFLSLRNRYVSTIILFVLLAVVFSFLQLSLMDDIFTYAAKQTMVNAAGEVLSMDFSSSSFYQDMSEVESSSTIYVELYRDKENLIYTTNSNSWIYDAETGDESGKVMLPRIMKILSHDDRTEKSYFEIRQEHFSSAKYIVYEESRGDLTTVIFYSVDTILDSAATAKVTLLFVSFAFLLIATTIILFYSRQIVSPIEQINNAAKKISEMDFSFRVPPFKVRDLNELGESVNSLSSSLSSNLKQLEETNERLREDIEREKKIEEARRQFVANASHELKTPIAIIQSYAEGIKYSDGEESVDEYCDVILDESEKMTRLIMRLLEIVKLQNEDGDADFERFDVDRWLVDFAKPYAFLAEKNGISFELSSSVHAECCGNTDMLGMVLSNFLSNAISHCDGEKKIIVSSRLIDDAVRVFVFNSGEHIGDDDMPNIWNSFYRADKAHSRAEGRFGLGLSIAKAAQDLHGRLLGAENVEGGVSFWFDIAVKQDDV